MTSEVSIKLSGNSKSGYFKNIKVKGSYFEMYYEYYNTGKLKHCGRLFSKEFADGTWFWFDEEGNITKYENYDAPYEFSWEDVQEFLRKENIKKETITAIHRTGQSGKHLWYISYQPKELLKTNHAKVIHLDGKTGNIVQTFVKDMTKHLD